MERVKISVILTVVFALSWRVRAAALTTWPSRLLLQKKIPLRLEHCRPLGYHETSKVNFVKGSSVDAEKNAFYWVLVSMKRLGCSELTNGYICSIFAPVFFTQYGTALPPCRSLCMKTRKACWNPIMAYMFLKCKMLFVYIQLCLIRARTRVILTIPISYKVSDSLENLLKKIL